MVRLYLGKSTTDLLLLARACAAYADCGRFIETVLLVKDRGRSQMQGAGHAVTEVTDLAFSGIRFEITDMTDPGGSFHFTAGTHQRSSPITTSNLLPLSNGFIMPTAPGKGKETTNHEAGELPRALINNSHDRFFAGSSRNRPRMESSGHDRFQTPGKPVSAESAGHD